MLTPLVPNGSDTELARLLHRARRVDLSTLLRLLEMARSHRGRGVSLVDLLRDRGLVGDDELHRLLASSAEDQPDDPAATKPHHQVLTPPGGIDRDPSLEATQLHPRQGASDLELSAGLEDSGELRARARAPRPGARVGPYLLREKLGAGGMGVVFLAEHTVTGARVALKTVSPAQADEETCARLRREGQAQALASAHPNVVRVYEQGEHEGLPYLTMEAVTGGSLRDRLRSGRLSPTAAAELALGLARGLAHMHAQGVLHRDLKPGNVLLDEAGTPRLVDFGLARFDGATTLTQTGTIMGTPLYMAPEQALGYRAEIGPPTDLYALGAMLFELLTGQPPFTASSSSEILVRALSEPPAPPSQLQPDVPPELDALCLALLAKDPVDRPDASATCEALRTYLGRRADGRARRAAGAGRIPVAAWALSAIGVATLGLGVGLLVFVRRALDELRAAQAAVAAVAAAPSPAATSAPVLAPSPSPRPSASPAASAPPPPAPDPAPLRASVGAAHRLLLTATVRASGPQAQDAARERVQTFEYTCRLGLRWAVERAEAGVLRGSATLERLGVQWSMDPPLAMLPAIDFDSERAPRPDEHYRKALGGTFQLDFDARSGAPSARGVAALQAAIWAGVNDRVTQQLHRVPLLSEEGQLAAVLGAVTTALPEPSGRDVWAREVPSIDLLALGRRGGGGVLQPPPPEPVRASFRVERTGGLLVDWGGAYEREVETGNTYEAKGATFAVFARLARELRAACVVEEGFFRRGTVRDTTRAQLVFVREGVAPQTPVAPTLAATTITLERLEPE